ncbi:hypothetical protein MVEN_02337600 [Mycena venus]|uniref:Uncharacterized protein n=1 Tax=Mycena venus TaxID=2733690 RepID=A0A8H7CF93_9AGAR|nr:hypothetical protein MVEN_02337600 [Mycena venus]
MPASWKKRRSPQATPSPEPEEPRIPTEPPLEDQSMDLDPPGDYLATNSAPADEPAVPTPPRTVIIEVEDEDAPGAKRWFEDYPRPAGCVLQPKRNVIETVFQAIRNKQAAVGLAPWAPFDSEDDWDLARWLSKAGISGGNINEFLKLKKIKAGAKPSYHNTRAFFQKIDALPPGPEWTCEIFEIIGDEKDARGNLKKEEVEFWKRDPVECIKELMGNAAFREKMRYAPQKELLPEGVTICPVILASDKTRLSQFSGDKQAWPVYLSVGNLSKATRSKPSERATVLLGYIPVCKLNCFSKQNRSAAGYQLFHRCMRIMLDSLVSAGNDGVDMLCADGRMGRVYPILAAYIADYPEQCLVACCKENRCPKCLVDPERRGMPVYSALRDPEQTIRLMKKVAKGLAPKEFDVQGLRPADPFWKDLPHCDIFQCFTPDILHQLHKGVFKEHIVSWATQSLGGSDTANEEEIDFRFRTMPSHPGLRHFKLGISLVSQWTGNEFKQMEKIFLGVINGAADPAVIRALEDAWRLFHANKDVFLTNGVRDHFNIPKIHSMQHYVAMIRALGTADGYNTELSERLHIDCAKLGYAASSKKEYIRQMSTWLMRREAIDKFASYLQWAIPGYLVELNDSADDSTASHDDNDDSDDESESEDIVDSSSGPAPAYTIAKKAPFTGVSVESLERDHGAKDFLWHLANFLRAETILPRDFDNISAPFSVYKCVVIKLQPVVQVSDAVTNDPIRAVCGTTSSGLKRAKAAHFDTVLARKEKPTAPAKRLSLDGKFFDIATEWIIN